MKAPRGQNFLYQPHWQQRVADAIVPPGRTAERLVEIGGGPGGLSALLAQRTRKLRIIENDRALAEGLRQRFAGQDGIEVVDQDVLAVDFRAAPDEGPQEVAGNLPYYITSPILLRLLHAAESIRQATLMVQKEVAERLTAVPGTRAFGLLTATTQLYARPQRVFDLPPGAFRPAPQVHSTLVRLEMAPRAAELGVDAAGFEAFLRRAFVQKRKQLGGIFGIALRARAEELSLEELARLYQELAQAKL